MVKIKEIIKYLTRKYIGYDLRSWKVSVNQDFIDQKSYLESGSVKIIFDVGANVGQTTSKYRKLFPKADIYGFEPFKEVFETYTKHFRGDSRTHGINIALSNENSEKTFFVNNHHYTNSLLAISKNGGETMKNFKTVNEIKVPTETIDSFCKKNNIKHIDILKLDVQGGELLVLQGAKEMLKKGAISLIYSEVEFTPLYQDQPLFSDIQKFIEGYSYKFRKSYNLGYDIKNNPVTGDSIFLNIETYYHSQYGQDNFLDNKVFKKMENGIFLELGADDGVSGSNTLFFEQKRNWSGLCIEPRKSAYDELVKNRGCITANMAISKDTESSKKFLEVEGGMGQLSGLVDTFDPRHLERVTKEAKSFGAQTHIIDVPSMTLNELFEKNHIDHVDYFSLDTEGGELDILESIDYKRFPVYCISVENKFENKKINAFMKKAGYRKVTRLKIDDIFVLRRSKYDIYREPIKIRISRTYRKFKELVKSIVSLKKI